MRLEEGSANHTRIDPKEPPPATPVPPAQGNDAINPKGLTVTPGAGDEQRQFESELIEADSLEKLQDVKANWGSEFRSSVMQQWQKDGRYKLLEIKVERLKERADENNLERF